MQPTITPTRRRDPGFVCPPNHPPAIRHTCPEARLLERWRRGDRRAGDRLLQPHLRSLRRFLVRRVGDAADDVLQETLLTCVRTRDGFRGETSFRAHLWRIVRCRLIDYFRRQSTRRAVIDMDASVDPEPTDGRDLEADLARRQAVRAAVDRLPRDLAVVVELHYWADASCDEISDLMDLPVGTVKNRLRRARDILARRMLPRRPHAVRARAA